MKICRLHPFNPIDIMQGQGAEIFLDGFRQINAYKATSSHVKIISDMSNFRRVVNVIPLTPVALSRTQIFSYLVPLNLQDMLVPGMLVRIPFRARTISGVVSSMELHRLPAETRGLKSLEAVILSRPVLSQQNLALANWIARYYVAPLGLVLKAMLPNFAKKPKDPGLVGYEKYNPDFILTDH